jgi:hypothetical protein
MVDADELNRHFFWGAVHGGDLTHTLLFAKETFLASQKLVLYTRASIGSNTHGRADAWIIAERLGKLVNTL